MNKYLMMENWLWLLGLLLLMACGASEKPATLPDRQIHTFQNPILAGFYPDPSICRAGEDYYLVNSTFAYFPGIPVFHSKDLVNWNLIGYAMDRPQQMDLTGMGVSRGIFAPAIRYHEGLFYITCTLVDGKGNFIVTAKDPAGPWSDPVWLPQINGIDPSPFFDDDGKAYVVYNSIPPDDQPLYEGHRTLRMRALDLEKLTLADEEILLVNGGTDISKNPVWIEAPHLFKKDGYYYLIAAEGGTEYNHSEVIFRSKTLTGPYQPYDKNPILTQRNLDRNRAHPITSSGHADFVETPEGEWWAVFLACRPYREDYYNTGRETFMAPVEWKEGWCVINPEFEVIQYEYPIDLQPGKKGSIPYSGNFTYRDNFDYPELNKNWAFLRTPFEKWYDVQAKKGFLVMQLQPETCAGKANPSFLGHRQQHLKGAASTELSFSAKGENEKAGLLIFQNEEHYYLLCQSVSNGQPVVQLFQSEGSALKLLAEEKITSGENLRLKIEAQGNTYAFSFAQKTDDWKTLKDNVDAVFLSTQNAGGFVGCMFALYASANGQASTTTADFDWFEYTGNDATF